MLHKPFIEFAFKSPLSVQKVRTYVRHTGIELRMGLLRCAHADCLHQEHCPVQPQLSVFNLFDVHYFYIEVTIGRYVAVNKRLMADTALSSRHCLKLKVENLSLPPKAAVEFPPSSRIKRRSVQKTQFQYQFCFTWRFIIMLYNIQEFILTGSANTFYARQTIT